MVGYFGDMDLPRENEAEAPARPVKLEHTHYFAFGGERRPRKGGLFIFRRRFRARLPLRALRFAAIEMSRSVKDWRRGENWDAAAIRYGRNCSTAYRTKPVSRISLSDVR